MKINKKRFWRLPLLGFIFFLTASEFLIAQQLPLFTQYRENISFLNPAAINSDYLTHEYKFSFGLSHRMHWQAEPQLTPVTQTAHIEYLRQGKSKVDFLLGGNFIQDKIGPTQTTGASARIAGVIGKTMDTRFIIGFNIGTLNHRINTTDFRSNDPILSQCNCNDWALDIGVGIFAFKRFQTGILEQDILYGGISLPQILLRNIDSDTESTNLILERFPHFSSQLGYYKFLDDNKFAEISLLLRAIRNTHLNISTNIRFAPISHFWLGVGYSTSQSVHAEFGIALGEKLSWKRNIRLGSGIDWNGGTTYGRHLGWSYEINISMAL